MYNKIYGNRKIIPERAVSFLEAPCIWPFSGKRTGKSGTETGKKT
jgi:hypothetical protein